MSSDYEKSYIERQLNLIESMILDYQVGAKSFYNLVQDIDGLIVAISEYEEDLSEKIRSKWWGLEQINAVLLYDMESTNNPKSYTKNRKKNIAECCETLLALVRGYIKKEGMHSEDP